MSRSIRVSLSALGAIVSFALLGRRSVTAQASVQPLQQELEDFARRNNMHALRTPVRGLKLGSVLTPQDQVVLTQCWTVKEVRLSVDTLDIRGVVDKNQGLHVGVSVLGVFGFSVGAGREQLDSVFITMSGLTIGDAADAAFNWGDPSCTIDIGKHRQRVLARLGQAATLVASVATVGGEHLALDSGTAKVGKVAVTLDGRVAESKGHGTVGVKGDSVAVARAVSEWELNSIECMGEHLRLVVGRALRAPTDCPETAPDDGWYRARIEEVQGDSAMLLLQPINVPGAQVRRLRVEVGAQFTLEMLPQRVDLGLVETDGGGYALTIKRLEVRRRPKVLGGRLQPLSRGQAAKPARLAEELADN
jgi:hypothetical protein